MLTTLKTVDAGADAEPGDQDGEGGKAGVPPQRAERVAQVLEQVGQGHDRLRRARRPFRLDEMGHHLPPNK